MGVDTEDDDVDDAQKKGPPEDDTVPGMTKIINRTTVRLADVEVSINNVRKTIIEAEIGLEKYNAIRDDLLAERYQAMSILAELTNYGPPSINAKSVARAGIGGAGPLSRTLGPMERN